MGGGDAGMEGLFRTGAIVGAVTKVVQALDHFSAALERSAVMNDAAGNRLANRNQYAAVSAFSSLPFTQTGGRLGDFWLSNSPDPGAGALRRFAGVGRGYADAIADTAYRADLLVAGQPTGFETARAIEEQSRRYRGLRFSADAAGVGAAAVAAGMPGYLREYNLHPELAMAQMARDLGSGQVGAAERQYAASQADVAAAQSQVAGARAARDRARGFADQGAAAFAPISPSAANVDRGSRAVVIAAENNLLEQQQKLEEALKRQEEASLGVARAKLDASRANTAVKQAELGVIEGKIGQQKSGLLGFAGMDYWGQRSVVDVARKWKDQGPGALLPDEVNLILPYLDEGNRELLVRTILANNSNFAQVQQNLGQQQLPALEQQRNVAVQAIIKAQVDEAQVTAAAQKAAEEVLGQLLKIMQEAMEGKLRILEAEQQKARAAQGGG
jgi:hypothetical protein